MTRAGLLVGGRGLRMGGVTKALLPHPDGGTLLDRWVARLRAHGLAFVLVGARDDLPPSLPSLADDPPGVGPIGALRALCLASDEPVIALACDMPFVSDAMLAALVAHPPAAAVVPRRQGRWEPLCGRYDPALVRGAIDAQIAAGRGSLQALCDAVGATELAWDRPGELDDWDTPDDVARGRAG